MNSQGSKRKRKPENDDKIKISKTKKPKSIESKVVEAEVSAVNGTANSKKLKISEKPEVSETADNLDEAKEPVHIMQQLKKSKKPKKKKKKPKNKKKVKTEDIIKEDESPLEKDDSPLEENELSKCDMQAWLNFGIAEPIIKALADQGFHKPTTIQELTLPAAMHGIYRYFPSIFIPFHIN